jgi:hypothetical protein
LFVIDLFDHRSLIFLKKTLNYFLTTEESSAVVVDHQIPFLKWRKNISPNFRRQQKMSKSLQKSTQKNYGRKISEKSSSEEEKARKKGT